MNNFSLNIKEEELSQSASMLLQRFVKRYKNINLNKYLTWCILRNIDARISSEIIIKCIEVNNNKNIQYEKIINELKEKLLNIIIKKSFTYKDQHNAYDIMSDIIIVLEKRDQLILDYSQKDSVIRIIKCFILWVNNKIKFK